MNQTTGDSKKKQITGGVVVKGEEKEPIQEIGRASCRERVFTGV